MNIPKVKSVIESVLYTWGEPISINELSKVVEITKTQMKSILDEMEKEYSDESRGLVLKKYDDFYQLKTKSENFNYITKLFSPKTKSNLSNSALEALSIVAYRQPVTKTEIDQIRGVKSDYIVRSLCEKELIYVSGKMDKPGRPMLYSTTTKFLSIFGIDSVKSLPKYDEVANYNIKNESEDIINEDETE